MLKNKIKNLLLQNQKVDALGLSMQHWGCRPYQVCSNDDPSLTLTYLTSMSNLRPNAFKLEKMND